MRSLSRRSTGSDRGLVYGRFAGVVFFTSDKDGPAWYVTHVVPNRVNLRLAGDTLDTDIYRSWRIL